MDETQSEPSGGAARERPAPPGAAAGKTLAPAARRALEEAEARRLAASAEVRPAEIHGRKGPEPVRYGDWEVKGIATDF